MWFSHHPVRLFILHVSFILKITDQASISITNDPKCNNIVRLYNFCWGVLFLCAPPYREVGALCRVQDTGSSSAESCSRALQQGNNIWVLELIAIPIRTLI